VGPGRAASAAAAIAASNPRDPPRERQLAESEVTFTFGERTVRVPACLRMTQLAAVRCRTENDYLQADSACCGSPQPIRLDF
jgi:hypothetical protein